MLLLLAALLAPSVSAETLPEGTLTAIKRVPPRGFERCLGEIPRGPKRGVSTVGFSISPEGKPFDVVTTKTLGPCTAKAARRSVRRWRYEPVVIDGVAVTVTDVTTNIFFCYDEGCAPVMAAP